MAQNPVLYTKKVEIIEEFSAYSVRWVCRKGHTNFSTVLSKDGNHHDYCLVCGRLYEFRIDEPKTENNE